MNRVYYLFFAAILLCSNAIAEKVYVKKGVLDLRNFDFEKFGTAHVSGEWEFYGGVLLTPEKIGLYQPDTFLNIPGYFGDVGFPQIGVATLRVKILTSSSKEFLTLYINDVLCSYKVWLDGVLMGEVGKVDLYESKPMYYPMVFNIPSQDTEHEIVLQVANHSHRLGGIYTELKIGTPRDIMIDRFFMTSKNLMTFTALLVMFIYNMLMFRLRRNEYSFFYLGIFAFLISYRSLLAEEKIIIYFLKNMSWQIMYKLDLMGFYIAVPFFMAYFTRLFPQASYRPFVLFSQLFLIALSLIVLFTPVSINIYTLDYAHLAIGACAIYSFVVMIISIYKRLPNAQLFGIAIFVLVFCTINDILMHQDIINSTELTQLGSVSFIFFQTYELYRRFNSTFVQNERLTIELENENKRLESRVEERTLELRTVNSNLLNNQQELMDLAESLEKASSDINRQKRELELQNDKLTQSIIYAAKIQNALLPSEDRLRRMFQDDFFVLWRPRDIVGGDFYWSFALDDRILVAGGDCTGHGVPGALLSMICIAMLNEAARRSDIQTPAQVLEYMRERIKAMLQQNSEDRKDGADVVFCEFNLKTNKLMLSGAKMGLVVVRNKEHTPIRESAHAKLFIIGDYQVLRILGGKQPIGPHPTETPFFNIEFACERGDRIYLFSDGLSDQFGGTLDNKLGLRPLLQMLVETQKPKISDQLSEFELLFDKWKGDRKQIDDIMLLGIEWKGIPKTKLMV